MPVKYGNILNIAFTNQFDGVVTDSDGNCVCDVKEWASRFLPPDTLGKDNVVELRIDLETGAILNWNPLTKSQIVDLIEEST
jgi:hypothetical protein